MYQEAVHEQFSKPRFLLAPESRVQEYKKWRVLRSLSEAFLLDRLRRPPKLDFENLELHLSAVYLR